DANKNIVWEFRFKDSTEYTYRLYDSSYISVGVPTVVAPSEFNVFPNPSDGVLTLDIDIPLSNQVTIEVLNVIGQRVYANSMSSASLSNTSIDLSALNKGYYFLTVTS